MLIALTLGLFRHSVADPCHILYRPCGLSITVWRPPRRTY